MGRTRKAVSWSEYETEPWSYGDRRERRGSCEDSYWGAEELLGEALLWNVPVFSTVSCVRGLLPLRPSELSGVPFGFVFLLARESGDPALRQG